jgi:hypothetical protein
MVSLGDLRRELRRLPRERRKEILAAVRAGRAVHDPQDAALAIAWAERLERLQWPSWVMPRTRPQGKRAWVWSAHLLWIVAALVIAVLTLWSSLPHAWRWPIVGIFAYSLLVTPFVMTKTLRAYWNAPEAAAANRRLLAQRQGE